MPTIYELYGDFRVLSLIACIGLGAVAGCGSSNDSTHPTTAATACTGDNCPPLWTWKDGSQQGNDPAVYGTMGVTDAASTPGARRYSFSVADSSNNVWLVSGEGYDAKYGTRAFNDVWKYSSGQWTWVNGLSNDSPELPQRGTKGTPDATNAPNYRRRATGGADAAGAIWLFGGDTNLSGQYGDLWRFASGQWTWLGGTDQPGKSFATKGVASPSNLPTARSGAVSWIDSSGAFWLFGGAISRVALNDLWQYKDGLWTLIAGTEEPDSDGNYGVQGVADPANTPNARSGSVACTDANGTLWMFGGADYNGNILQDLWKFAGGQWTWVAGPKPSSKATVAHGDPGTADSANIPAPRTSAAAWCEGTAFWLFGGMGLGVSESNKYGAMNDLWRYADGKWAWMGGTAETTQSAGVYGTKGTAAASNVPKARYGSAYWKDSAGDFWVYGGSFDDSTILNDLWVLHPPH